MIAQYYSVPILKTQATLPCHLCFTFTHLTLFILMRRSLLFLLCVLLVHVRANTEKLMFRAKACGQSSDSAFDKVPSLSPPFSQLTRAIVPEKKQVYALSGLTPGSSYELRVSYSASVRK